MAEEKRRAGKLLPGVWRGDFHRWKGSKFRPVIIVMSEFEQKLDFPCSQNNNNPTCAPVEKRSGNRSAGHPPPNNDA